MTFISIDPATIQVGKAIKKELFDLIKGNFDDHETRLQGLSGTSGLAPLINETVYVGSNATPLLTGIYYLEIIQQCVATSLAIQIFEKAPASIGQLKIDVRKNTSTNPAGFVSIMTTQPLIDMTTDSDFVRKTGIIDTSKQLLSVGTIVRIDITSLPVGLQKFRIVLTGDY